MTKKRYRIFLRSNGVFYLKNNESGKQTSLNTRDREAAIKTATEMNEALKDPLEAREKAKRVLEISNARVGKHTWQEIMNEVSDCSTESTRKRREREYQSKRYDRIRSKELLDTSIEDFRAVLKNGGSATNLYLKLLQNRALNLEWIFKPVIPKGLWPKPKKSKKRAITFEEHNRIVAAEGNLERKLYYQILWYTGASQADGARLTAENIDRLNKVIRYSRCKNESSASVTCSKEFSDFLDQFPALGPLFPKISKTNTNARSSEFTRRCKTLGIKGISLHSYRYSWAERAAKKGYPQRWAMKALGHNSRAVHQAYAKNAEYIEPSMDDFELKAR